MKTKKILSVLLAAAMMSAMFTGCGGGDSAQTGTNADADANANSGTQTGDSGNKEASGSGEIKEFTAFFAVPG